MNYVNDRFSELIQMPQNQAAIEAMKRDVDAFMPSFSDSPDRLSRWGHHYFCDDDGGRLIFDLNSPHSHRCEICGKEYSNEVQDGVWVTFYRNRAVVLALVAATVYKATGERRYRDYAVQVIDFYAEHYHEFALHNYEHCADCGRLVEFSDLRHLNDDDVGYCESCYSRHCEAGGVQSYCYKPEPIFYGSGPRYFGVELEVDEGGESDIHANMICRVGNQNGNHIYIKHDGSLDDGLEIVTHPMTLDYHMDRMPWREVLNEALDLGYTSHQTGTCGLHVHVNRTSLGDSYQQREDTIARILFLVENFWNELLRFSRRTQGQLNRWAARYGRKDDPKDVLHSAKSRGDRYTCVNLTPHSTIEFRMFRGTLKYNTLIATLQLVERLCSVAFYLSDDEIKNVTWIGFVSDIPPKDMPELIQYLKERRLYVNEPVAASEEV